jgi:hypothetical protein
MPASSLTKFTITPLTPPGTTSKFVAMINPDGYTITSNIKYTSTKIPGQPGQSQRFQAREPDKITIKPFILDGTGAIDGSANTVSDRIRLLQSIVEDFDGEEHECKIVMLSWGTFCYVARLDKLEIEYTMFDPQGVPLRAKVTMDFTTYQTFDEILADAGLSSPDLTHVVEVKAGDKLPLLCNRIYKSADHLESVARFNGLTSLRDVRPGTQLLFPPLAV